MLAMSLGAGVLLALVILLPMAIMGTAVYIAPRAIPWARVRAEAKRRKRQGDP
jgi:hypothetical protein